MNSNRKKIETDRLNTQPQQQRPDQKQPQPKAMKSPWDLFMDVVNAYDFATRFFGAKSPQPLTSLQKFEKVTNANREKIIKELDGKFNTNTDNRASSLQALNDSTNTLYNLYQETQFNFTTLEKQEKAERFEKEKTQATRPEKTYGTFASTDYEEQEKIMATKGKVNKGFYDSFDLIVKRIDSLAQAQGRELAALGKSPSPTSPRGDIGALLGQATQIRDQIKESLPSHYFPEPPTHTF